MKICLRQKPFHHSRIRSYDYVVLVHAHRVVALGLQYAYHPERHLVETDSPPDRVASVREEIVGYGLTYHTYFCGRIDVGFREHLPVFDIELPDLQIVNARSGHGRRVIVVAADELAGGGDIWADGRQEDRPLLQRFVVFDFQSLHLGRVEPDSGTPLASRENHYDIRTHALDFVLDTLLGTLPESYHGYHGCYSDDDSQHREDSSHLIVGQSLQRYFE